MAKPSQKQLRNDIKARVQARTEKGLRAPGLAVVLVGADPASTIYVGKKVEACKEVGFTSQKIELPAETTQEQLIATVDQLNEDHEVDGILVQLPLPKHLDSDAVLDRIKSDKDVDGFHPENLGMLVQKRPRLRSCTPYGVMKMLEATGIELVGKQACVVGASNIVGRPMAMELLLANCTVTICNSKTTDLASHVGRADVVVAAVGIPEMVKGEWIKPGAVVVDVGMNRLDNGKLAGDVEYAAAAERASWITPVPGGVGPMTVATLLENTLYAAEHLH